MNSINKNSLLIQLKEYLNLYKQIFNKCAFNNFVALSIAIIGVQYLRSVKFLYDKFISKYFCGCLNKFYYFLANDNFNVSNIALCTIKILLRLIPSELKKEVSIYLTIDDTLQKKFGTHFDCYQKFFDHAKHDNVSYLYGHCFVLLCASIPIVLNNKIKYITVPLCFKLYNKSETKLEMATSMIKNVMLELLDYQTIILCDSCYTKKPLIKVVNEYNNLDIIAGVRADTALYNLAPEPTLKRGRPRKRGEQIDYKNLKYVKEGNYYIANKKCMTNLFDYPVFITVTVKDIEKFSSVRVYISTIEQEKVKSFESNEIEQNENAGLLDIYKMRWKIEVMFYELKTFWSFGEYMVRSQKGIENYVNMIGVTISMVTILPFMNKDLSKYQYQSPQEIKYSFEETITQELILSNLLKTLKFSKNNIEIYDLIEYLTYLDKVS